MSNPSFEINKILKIEAAEIASARERAFSIHHTNDIDAAGDEIEQKVREILRRKLPLDYYIGHGHIVDETLNYNGQHDIIIADNSGSPILFKAENGTEYFPYESIYAIGEIKSTYVKSKKYFETFVARTTKLYSELSRIQTDQNQLTKDLRISFGDGIGFTPGDTRDYKNPVFKILFFVDGGDFKIEQLADLYKSTECKFLPNIVCILNRGILAMSKIIDSKLGPIDLFPEFIPKEELPNYKWTFLELGKDTDPEGAHLAFVFFALNEHLRKCIVTRPNLLKYFKHLFKQQNAVVQTLDPKLD